MGRLSRDNGTDLPIGRHDRGRCKRPVRNASCPCGSGKRYKNCCLEHDRIQRRKDTTAALPYWIVDSKRKLYLFEKYSCKVFDLPRLIAGFRDWRQNPEHSTFDVVNSLFHAALLRLPSINALEGNLKEADFQKLIGHKTNQDVKAFSAEVVSNTLDKLDLNGPRRAIEDVIWRAERNKTFREGSYGALRCVVIDGWEPFASYNRHCAQ